MAEMPYKAQWACQKVELTPKSLKIKDLCFYGPKWGYVESVENSVAYVE